MKRKIEKKRTHPQEDETSMSQYKAVGLAEGWIEGSEEEVISAWQYLVDTGLAWSLQGFFGRTASHLIDRGIIQAA